MRVGKLVLVVGVLCLLGIQIVSGGEATRVVREHGKFRELSRLEQDSFQNNPLNQQLMSHSNFNLLSPNPQEKMTGAWLTHLTNDYFIPGARVLGQSILATDSQYPLVLLYTDGVSKEGLKLLKKDGVWQLKHVSNLKNPNSDHYMFQQRLKDVYTKCHIYNQTEYDKIVYLDSDIILLENSDELFQCPGFCASIRHSFFNTGVIVARPSRRFFTDVVEKFPTLPSYNGGEQGLMNSYFWDFDIKCPMFHDDPETLLRFSQNEERCGRLPSYYNGDIGPYYLHDASWLLPEQRNSPKILHFTLGTFKPWEWWWYPVFDVCWIWYEMYLTVPQVPSFSQQITHWKIFLAITVPFLLLTLIGVKRSSFFRSFVDPILKSIVSISQKSETLLKHTIEFLTCQSCVMLSSLSLVSSLMCLYSSVMGAFWFVNFVIGSEVIHPGLCLFIAVEYGALLLFVNGVLYYRFMYLTGASLYTVVPRLFDRMGVPKNEKQSPGSLYHRDQKEEEYPKAGLYTALCSIAFLVLLSGLGIYASHPSWYTLSSKILTAVVVAITLLYLWCVMALYLPFEWMRAGYQAQTAR